MVSTLSVNGKTGVLFELNMSCYLNEEDHLFSELELLKLAAAHNVRFSLGLDFHSLDNYSFKSSYRRLNLDDIQGAFDEFITGQSIGVGRRFHRIMKKFDKIGITSDRIVTSNHNVLKTWLGSRRICI